MGQRKWFSALTSMSTRGIEDVALPEGGVDGINYCDFIERSVLAMMPFDGVNPRSMQIMANSPCSPGSGIDGYCWLFVVVLTRL